MFHLYRRSILHFGCWGAKRLNSFPLCMFCKYPVGPFLNNLGYYLACRLFYIFCVQVQIGQVQVLRNQNLIIGLDSYSRQRFIYLSPILIYNPLFDLYRFLNRLAIWNSQNCSMFHLAFFARSLQGHWWGFISRNYVVWPIFCLMNVFIALKGTHFWFLFAFTAAGVVPCGGRKTSPSTATIVQFIFYFWSFEISVNILRNQKWMIGLDSYSRQVLII